MNKSTKHKVEKKKIVKKKIGNKKNNISFSDGCLKKNLSILLGILLRVNVLSYLKLLQWFSIF